MMDVLDYILIIPVSDNILGKSHYALLIRDIRFSFRIATVSPCC